MLKQSQGQTAKWVQALQGRMQLTGEIKKGFPGEVIWREVLEDGLDFRS